MKACKWVEQEIAAKIKDWADYKAEETQMRGMLNSILINTVRDRGHRYKTKLRCQVVVEVEGQYNQIVLLGRTIQMQTGKQVETPIFSAAVATPPTISQDME